MTNIVEETSQKRLLFHDFCQLTHVGHFVVDFRIRLRIDVIAEKQAANIVVLHGTCASLWLQVLHQPVDIHLELGLKRLLNNVKKEGSIAVVDETIVEDAIHFVHPETNELVAFSHVRARCEKNALDDARKVAKIENVVRFRRGRQEIRDR